MFWPVIASVLWLWLETEIGSVTGASLTSFVLIGYGLCKFYLLGHYPDPRQGPADRERNSIGKAPGLQRGG